MTSPLEPEVPSAGTTAGRRWRSWLSGLLITAALIAAVLHFGDLQRFAALVRQARPLWLVLAVVIQSGTYVALATGWRQVLRVAGHDRPLAPLIRIAVTKLFADQAVPTGGMSGNILLVDQLIGLGIARGVASAALIVSIVGYYAAYALCALATFALLWLNHEASPALASVLTIFMMVAVGIPAVVLWMARRAAGRLAERLRKIGWLARTLETIAAAPPDLLRDRGLLARVAACSLAVFAADAMTLWICLHALGLDAAPWKAFVALITASIVATIGPIPMGLGTYEASSTATLHVLGIPAEGAFAATMLLRLFILWLPLIPGLMLMRKAGRHRIIPHGEERPMGRQLHQNDGPNIMRSVIYVSRPRIEPTDRAQILDDLQAVSIARNSSLDITGILIATSGFFAEHLEGPADSVDAVMASIVADPRHHDLRIVQQKDIAASRFYNWRMLRFEEARAGESGIADVIAAAYNRGDPPAVRRLERLIDALADGRGGPKK